LFDLLLMHPNAYRSREGAGGITRQI